jgi:P27 family predicted phage terminase small subunit
LNPDRAPDGKAQWAHAQNAREIPMRNSDGPPNHLSAEARRLWKRIRDDYAIDDSAGLLLLQNALEAHDRLVEARRLLKRDGLLVRDRFGQEKQHPATLIERDARSQVLASLRALKLAPSALD